MWHRVGVALTNRNFRLVWLAALGSTIGTWMQQYAQGLLVYKLPNSSFYLGLDSALGQLPILLFMLIGGVIADRYDRRKLLTRSQLVQAFAAFSLALLVFSGQIRIWHILFFSFFAGCGQAFGGPAYQSLIPSLVDKKDLPNAVALNSIQFNIARVLGPLAFAFTLSLYRLWGYSEPQAMNACFLLNSLSFLVVIATLLMLRVKHIPPARSGPMREELRIGLSYVRHHSSLAALIVLAAATTFLGFALLTFLPIFAQKVFHEGAGTYSHLMAFSGAGSILGALIVAWRGKFPKMGWTALLVQAVYGILIICFAVSRVLWLSDILLFMTGAALMVVFSTVTSLVQMIAPNEMRGRVMSIYMLAFRGGMPLGSLVSGYLATYLGAPLVIGINGALLVVVAIYFLTRNHGVLDA